MKVLTSFAAVMLTVLAVNACASNVDDIIALSKKNVGEEVIIAAVDKSPTGFTLGAADILKLKDANVSDKVITAMLKHKGTGVAEAPAPAEARPVERDVARQDEAPAAGEGTLNIENVDDKAWSYSFEPDAKTIWITGAAEKGRIDGHGGLSLRMAAGTYNVKYNGQDKGQTVTIFANDKSLLLLSRVNTDELEALYVSVFEKGERKSGGRLVVLRSDSGAAEKKKKATIERNDDEYAQGYTAPRERVVERVVEAPSTTVIYRDAYPAPVYVTPVYPRYYTGPYYSSRYYSRGYSGYGYSRYHHGGRSSVSVGIGFGF